MLPRLLQLRGLKYGLSPSRLRCLTRSPTVRCKMLQRSQNHFENNQQPGCHLASMVLALLSIYSPVELPLLQRASMAALSEVGNASSLPRALA